MEASLGSYLMGNDTGVAADETKTRFAVDILRHHQPRFMTVHLSSLDDAEHAHGPFSPEANADLEAIDGMVARLVGAARDNDPAAIAVVVSDHGFAELTHLTHLYVPFLGTHRRQDRPGDEDRGSAVLAGGAVACGRHGGRGSA
jgi:predicted AlkP superfamily pyrophosphatase or phosphodiesterase